MRNVLLRILMVFICACSNDKNLSEENHSWLEKFLRYFMFYENGIYTLLGSKPLTSMIIFINDLPEDQLREKEREQRVYFLLNSDNKKDIEFYNRLSSDEKEKKAHLIRDRDFIYNINDLWEKWEKTRFFINKNFLLVKKIRAAKNWEKLESCKKVYDIFFVNVHKTALVIQENYDLFRQVVGYDFDPLKLVFELENEKSPFWDKIMGDDSWKYSVLWGLLFGFGKENSFSYLWASRHIRGMNLTQQENQWSLTLPSWSSCNNYPSVSDKNAFSIFNFSIPLFKSFIENDPIVLKYEKEKEEIKKMYKGKDFVSYTLEFLCENP